MRRAEPRTDLPPAVKCGSPFLRVSDALNSPAWAGGVAWKSWRSGHIADYHIERNEGPAMIVFNGSQVWLTSRAYDLDYDPTDVQKPTGYGKILK